MKTKLSNLWRWDGTLGRGEYLGWGVALFALKYNLDRLVSWMWFRQPWSLFDLEQARLYLWQSLPPGADRGHLLTLLALSLPFLWAGVVLTLRRLRSVGLPVWWVALFFVPLLKLLLFALLCLLPARVENAPARTRSRRDWLGSFIPRHPAGSAAMALGVSLTLAVGSVWMGTTVLRDYGWTLFVGLPFLTPLLAVLLYTFHGQRSLGACLALANGTIALAGVGLVLFAMEGVLCIVMAAPLAFAVGSAGGAVGYGIQKSFAQSENSTRLFCMALLAVPTTMTVEHALPPPLPLLEVKSSVVVNAPPERVWRHVVAFSELPPPREFIFRMGVAYPVRAEIHGRGVGAVRHCNFSTGPFVEPILIWDEPRLLQFSVTKNPAPMQEWTPYRRVHPPHLDGFLESKAGQFRLVPLGEGRTLLEGTTWYHHRLWPARYWQVWSDFIIHKIHLRVLDHVKQLSERSAP